MPLTMRGEDLRILLHALACHWLILREIRGVFSFLHTLTFSGAFSLCFEKKRRRRVLKNRQISNNPRVNCTHLRSAQWLSGINGETGSMAATPTIVGLKVQFSL